MQRQWHCQDDWQRYFLLSLTASADKPISTAPISIRINGQPSVCSKYLPLK